MANTYSVPSNNDWRPLKATIFQLEFEQLNKSEREELGRKKTRASQALGNDSYLFGALL